MTATTLPAVQIIWHGKNDYGTHDVATKNTIGQWVASLPEGTVFTAQEATEHIANAVQEDVQLIERVYGTKDAEAHDPALHHEMSNQSDVQAVGYALDEDQRLKVVSEHDFGYACDPQTRYRRI